MEDTKEPVAVHAMPIEEIVVWIRLEAGDHICPQKRQCASIWLKLKNFFIPWMQIIFYSEADSNISRSNVLLMDFFFLLGAIPCYSYTIFGRRIVCRKKNTLVYCTCFFSRSKQSSAGMKQFLGE